MPSRTSQLPDRIPYQNDNSDPPHNARITDIPFELRSIENILINHTEARASFTDPSHALDPITTTTTTTNFNDQLSSTEIMQQPTQPTEAQTTVVVSAVNVRRDARGSRGNQTMTIATTTTGRRRRRRRRKSPYPPIYSSAQLPPRTSISISPFLIQGSLLHTTLSDMHQTLVARITTSLAATDIIPTSSFPPFWRASSPRSECTLRGPSVNSFGQQHAFHNLKIENCCCCYYAPVIGTNISPPHAAAPLLPATAGCYCRYDNKNNNSNDIIYTSTDLHVLGHDDRRRGSLLFDDQSLLTTSLKIHNSIGCCSEEPFLRIDDGHDQDHMDDYKDSHGNIGNHDNNNTITTTIRRTQDFQMMFAPALVVGINNPINRNDNINIVINTSNNTSNSNNDSSYSNDREQPTLSCQDPQSLHALLGDEEHLPSLSRSPSNEFKGANGLTKLGSRCKRSNVFQVYALSNVDNKPRTTVHERPSGIVDRPPPPILLKQPSSAAPKTINVDKSHDSDGDSTATWTTCTTCTTKMNCRPISSIVRSTCTNYIINNNSDNEINNDDTNNGTNILGRYFSHEYSMRSLKSLCIQGENSSDQGPGPSPCANSSTFSSSLERQGNGPRGSGSVNSPITHAIYHLVDRRRSWFPCDVPTELTPCCSYERNDYKPYVLHGNNSDRRRYPLQFISARVIALSLLGLDQLIEFVPIVPRNNSSGLTSTMTTSTTTKADLTLEYPDSQLINQIDQIDQIGQHMYRRGQRALQRAKATIIPLQIRKLQRTRTSGLFSVELLDCTKTDSRIRFRQGKLKREGITSKLGVLNRRYYKSNMQMLHNNKNIIIIINNSSNVKNHINGSLIPYFSRSRKHKGPIEMTRTLARHGVSMTSLRRQRGIHRHGHGRTSSSFATTSSSAVLVRRGRNLFWPNSEYFEDHETEFEMDLVREPLYHHSQIATINLTDPIEGSSSSASSRLEEYVESEPRMPFKNFKGHIPRWNNRNGSLESLGEYRRINPSSTAGFRSFYSNHHIQPHESDAFGIRRGRISRQPAPTINRSPPQDSNSVFDPSSDESCFATNQRDSVQRSIQRLTTPEFPSTIVTNASANAAATVPNNQPSEENDSSSGSRDGDTPVSSSTFDVLDRNGEVISVGTSQGDGRPYSMPLGYYVIHDHLGSHRHQLQPEDLQFAVHDRDQPNADNDNEIEQQQEQQQRQQQQQQQQQQTTGNETEQRQQPATSIATTTTSQQSFQQYHQYQQPGPHYHAMSRNLPTLPSVPSPNEPIPHQIRRAQSELMNDLHRQYELQLQRRQQQRRQQEEMDRSSTFQEQSNRAYSSSSSSSSSSSTTTTSQARPTFNGFGVAMSRSNRVFPDARMNLQRASSYPSTSSTPSSRMNESDTSMTFGPVAMTRQTGPIINNTQQGRSDPIVTPVYSTSPTPTSPPTLSSSSSPPIIINSTQTASNATGATSSSSQEEMSSQNESRSRGPNSLYENYEGGTLRPSERWRRGDDEMIGR